MTSELSTAPCMAHFGSAFLNSGEYELLENLSVPFAHRCLWGLPTGEVRCSHGRAAYGSESLHHGETLVWFPSRVKTTLQALNGCPRVCQGDGYISAANFRSQAFPYFTSIPLFPALQLFS